MIIWLSVLLLTWEEPSVWFLFKGTGFLTAIAECRNRAFYLDSKSNRISEHLSRWSLDDFQKQQFFLLTNQFQLQEFVITDNMFQLLNDW